LAALVAGLLLAVTTGCSTLSRGIPQTRCQKRPDLDPRLEAAIDEFRGALPALMRKREIPGCAMALVDAQGILWTEAFGYADPREKRPVTPATLFSTMSISKAFTAVAVLLAVQDGLLDLDEPITTYLPDFQLNSRYEENPERKVTLRHLLSHTSGLQQDAPVGNAAEPTGSFEERVRSLYGTWLRFPVGEACAYSNAGVDLAGYVLQVVAGLPFEQCLRQRLFSPLGMCHSTADRQEFLEETDRAVGHTVGIRHTSFPGPALAAAGLYSGAAELARFVQMNLNHSNVNGAPLLEKTLLDGMAMAHASRGLPSEPEAFCGLGLMLKEVHRPEADRVDLLVYHGGGGAGCATLMYWFPEYGFGGVALSNRHPNPEFEGIALRLPNLLIDHGLVARQFQHVWSQHPRCVGPFSGWPSPRPTASGGNEWGKYAGTYRFKFSGYEFKGYARVAMGLGIGSVTPTIKVSVKNGTLWVKESQFFAHAFGNAPVKAELQEIKPGLFFTSTGDCLDFTGDVPRYNNYRIEKR
jgi:CubicO group peptidase (beta-lactamase class C family)